MIEQAKVLNVAIVGGGPGCKAIMEMIFGEKLRELRMNLIGIASTNPEAVGYRYAQDKGIYTTMDYRDLYKLRDLHMIIELTGRKEVADAIGRTKPDHIRLMDHVTARLFWDVFHIEEERIAERKRAEEELLRISKAVESSSDAIGMSDRQGHHFYQNRAFTDLFEYTAQELEAAGGGPAVYVDSEIAREVFTEIMNGKSWIGETEMVSKSGRKFPAFLRADAVKDDVGNIIGLIGIHTDITEHKRTEAALVQAKEDWENTFDAITDMVMLLDNEHQILRVNEAVAQALNTTKESLVGKKCYKAIHGENHPIRRCPLVLTMKTIEPTTAEIIDSDLGGTFICSTSPILDGEGKLTGYTHTLKNITESKHLEAQLQQAQKMEAIGTLAGGIAHDFNNLLMGVQGNISLMLLDVDSSYPQYQKLKSIEKQVQSGAKLTSHLLGYARKGRYEVKPVDLNQMLKEASETFGRTRKEITIHRELAEDLFAIKADSGQIEQLLLNLYVNAADAMPGGGDLILKTKNVTHKDMKGKLYDPKPGKYVLLTVTDTGIGMDKETMERVFDPFFTTKEIGRGTGLGLASAYGIIKGHGGYVDVDSKKGKGTTFSIYLPASEREVQKVVKTAGKIIEGTETVLLVDDEENIRQVGQELLEAIGHRVLLARDGGEAVRLYEENRDNIDMVLLDMVMPNMGGGEAYDRMKKINPNIKVLLSSGYSIDGEATDILERGCDGFIQKPFTMKELSGKVREILEKK